MVSFYCEICKKLIHVPHHADVSAHMKQHGKDNR